MYYFCTYFDKNYLDKGMALYQSLVSHCKPFTLWILCMDDDVYRILNAMHLKGVTLISLADFEWENKGLAEAKKNRSLMEYYFTCTPSLIDYVINNIPQQEVITYLDADLFFFSSIEPVYQELKYGSILIIEHRFSRNLKHLEKYGHYNVGLISFRKNNNGITCLNWWRDRCLEWCYDRLEDGKFADQAYLDDWAYRFTGVIVLVNKAAGLAPWNLNNYTYTQNKINPVAVLVDGQPLIMYHFHGVKWVSLRKWDIDLVGYTGKINPIVKENIYVPYLTELSKYAEKRQQSIRKRFEEWTSVNNTVTNLKRIGIIPLKYIKKLMRGDFVSVP